MSLRVTLALLFTLSACAMQEEPLVLEEPLEIVRDAVPVCDPNDEDGIGGTGCEPVARQSLHPFME